MSVPNFELRQELAAHSKCVRCLCVLEDGSILTGGLDGQVILWTYRRDPDFCWSPEHAYQHSGGAFVYSITAPPQQSAAVNDPSKGRADDHDDESSLGHHVFFFSGGSDRVISALNRAGDVLRVYVGHEGPISSLLTVPTTKSDKRHLISGSWDATARVWDIESAETLATLSGHRYAVTCAALKTTSGAVKLLTGSQDGNIHVWDMKPLPTKTQTITGAHDDIVRGIVPLCKSAGLSQQSGPETPTTERFFSFSNDGSFSVFELSNQDESGERFVLQTKKKDAHSSFIFGGCCLPVETISKGKAAASGALLLITGGEDRLAMIWDSKSESLLQPILHKATVWQVAALPSGEFCTACEDSVVRIWTADPSRVADERTRLRQRDEAKQEMDGAKEKSKTAEFSKAPHVSQLASIRGTATGQHKVFQDEGKYFAYLWNGNAWEKVGEVMGEAESAERQANTLSIAGTFYEGDDYFPPGTYDFVFDVELAGGRQYRKLPFNAGQNSLVAAERFIAREGLSRVVVSQIVQFIQDNTRGVTRAQPEAAGVQSTPIGVSLQLLPVKGVQTFKGLKVGPLKAKLEELNEAKPEDDPKRLSSTDWTYVCDALDKISKESFLNIKFRQCEMDAIFKSPLKTYEGVDLLPVLDLWRMMALHDQSTGLHKHSDGGMAYISVALKCLETPSAGAARVCAVRYLANLHEYSTTRMALLRYHQRLFQTFERIIDSPESSKQVKVGVATILLNYAVAFDLDRSSDWNHTGPSLLLELLLKFCQSECKATDSAADVIYRLLAAFGTLLLAYPNLKSTLDSQQLRVMTEEIRAKRDLQLTKIVEEIEKVL